MRANGERDAKALELASARGEVASLARHLEDLAQAADVARAELTAQQERKNRAVHAAKAARAELRERDEALDEARAALEEERARARAGATSRNDEHEKLAVLRDMVRSLRIECDRRRRRERKLEDQLRRAGVRPSAAGERAGPGGKGGWAHAHDDGSQLSSGGDSPYGASPGESDAVSLPSIQSHRPPPV